MGTIKNIEAATLKKILNKSAHVLPDNPTASGMSPSEIKEYLHAFVTDSDDSVLSELSRVIEELNTYFDKQLIIEKEVTSGYWGIKLKDLDKSIIRFTEEGAFWLYALNSDGKRIISRDKNGYLGLLDSAVNIGNSEGSQFYITKDKIYAYAGEGGRLAENKIFELTKEGAEFFKKIITPFIEITNELTANKITAVELNANKVSATNIDVDSLKIKNVISQAFTEVDKTNLDINTANRHNHENKSVLDRFDGVEDNFSSTSGTKALSANKGRELKNLIDSKETAKTYSTIKNMIDYLNSLEVPASDFRVGYNLFIEQTEVPDFWITEILTEKIEFEYIDDNIFIEEIKVRPIQIGWYKLSLLETHKVDLTDYVIGLTINGANAPKSGKNIQIVTDSEVTKDSKNLILSGAVEKALSTVKLLINQNTTNLSNLSKLIETDEENGVSYFYNVDRTVRIRLERGSGGYIYIERWNEDEEGWYEALVFDCDNWLLIKNQMGDTRFEFQGDCGYVCFYNEDGDEALVIKSDGNTTFYKDVTINGNLINEQTKKEDKIFIVGDTVPENAYRNLKYADNSPKTVVFYGEKIFNNNAFSGTGVKEVKVSTISDITKSYFSNAYANPLSNGAILYIDNEILTDINITDRNVIDGVIPDYAFFQMQNNIQNIDISAVTKIGLQSFYKCTKVRADNIVFNNEIEINSEAFHSIATDVDAIKNVEFLEKAILLNTKCFYGANIKNIIFQKGYESNYGSNFIYSKIDTVTIYGTANLRNSDYGQSLIKKVICNNYIADKNIQNSFYNCNLVDTIKTIDLHNTTTTTNSFLNCTSLTNLTLLNINVNVRIGSGSRWGHLLTLDSLINTVKELWTSTTEKTLTMGGANLEKIANTYVKLVDITDEMREADEYIDKKLPCEVCESTDEGAMTLTEYATLKYWDIQ